MTKQQKRNRLTIALAGLILLLLGCVGLYAADYYHADSHAAQAMAGTDTVTVTTDDGLTMFVPDESAAGLIFYPGGKVEHTAYAPLMELLASNGVLCVVTEMPLHLAVLDMDAAEGVPGLFPEVETWYMGGHSLGGAMAASYAADNGDFAGLVLLGAYSTADLNHSGLRVLSIYGSNDGVLNREKYEQYRPNLPEDTVELVIDGGNHAMFGDYGVQEGDGEGWVSPLEQQVLTAHGVLEWMGLRQAEEAAEVTYRAWVRGQDGTMLRSVLTLMTDTGEYVLSRSMLSSILYHGSYAMEGDVLVCSSSGGTYRFRLTDEGLTYMAEGSDDIYAHGSILGDDPNATVLVPDGTVYRVQ